MGMQVKYGCDDSIQEGCSSSRVIGDAHKDGFILYSKELSTSAGEMSIMRMNMIKILKDKNEISVDGDREMEFDQD